MKSLVNSVCKYSFPAIGSNSFCTSIVCGFGEREKVSYGANRGDGVSGTRRWFMGLKPLLGTESVEGVEYSVL
jgi:hypothetical protein